jgi:hypothetical protein
MKCIVFALLLCCYATPALTAEEVLRLPAYDAKAFCEQRAKSGFLKECLQKEEEAYDRLIGGMHTTGHIFETCRVSLDAIGLESYAAFEHCLKKNE